MSAQKEYPIIFSTPMIQAILSGRKSQTRRIIKPQPKGATYWTYHQSTPLKGAFYPNTHDAEPKLLKCPYGQVGDRLWVRETWTTRQGLDKTKPSDIDSRQSIAYIADNEAPYLGKIRPSIHMPRWASRINLEITDIRVERVQEMPAEDILKEGVELPDSGINCDISSPPDAYENWSKGKREEWIKGQARATYFARCADVQICFEAFEKLWDSINAKWKRVWNKELKIYEFWQFPWSKETAKPVPKTTKHPERYHGCPNPWHWGISFRMTE